MEESKLEYEYYKEEIKRCFLCNDWIEGKIKRQKIFNKVYHYHLECYCQIQKYHLRQIEKSLILLSTPY